MNRYRNTTLDVIKLCTSYMVVFIHILFYGKTGAVVAALARFAVPLFFLVSGYHSYQATPDKIKRRIVRLIGLLVFAIPVYTCYHVFRLCLKHGVQGIGEFFIPYLDPTVLLKLFVFNVPVHAFHLWYIFAIIYVYLIFYLFIVHNISDKLISAISILFLTLQLFMGEVLSAFNIHVPFHFIRNFLLMGFPFFGLGVLANKHEHELRKLSDCIIVIFAIIGVLETLLSLCLFGKNDLYIGSLFILFSIVIVFIKYPNVEFPPIVISLAECSTYIYILHPMISSALRIIYDVLGVDGSSVVLQMIHPLIVCLFSTITAYALIKITQITQRLIRK